jgi:hypothetical protein
MSLQKLKSKLAQEVELVENESKCVKNFQTELDLLIQEKLAHLEELKQIQNDIQAVSNFETRLNLIIWANLDTFFKRLRAQSGNPKKKKRKLSSQFGVYRWNTSRLRIASTC